MMTVTLWGTRGSLAAPGPETAHYGGNTFCVEVRGSDGTVLVLDAGTGIRRLGVSLPRSLSRVNLLLTHLHMDHLQGLGFFAPLYNPSTEVHIWGPASTTLSLRMRLPVTSPHHFFRFTCAICPAGCSCTKCRVTTSKSASSALLQHWCAIQARRSGIASPHPAQRSPISPTTSRRLARQRFP
jgi:phosphoribosyl 1,2-cyclic phosphodiesterase